MRHLLGIDEFLNYKNFHAILCLLVPMISSCEMISESSFGLYFSTKGSLAADYGKMKMMAITGEPSPWSTSILFLCVPAINYLSQITSC